MWGPLPASSQPEVRPLDGFIIPLVSPEEAAKLGLTEQPIKLHLRDVTLADALDELSKQSGVLLDASGPGGREVLVKKLSLDIETRSFNEAFAAVLDEADVTAKLRKLGDNDVWNLMFGRQEESEAPESGRAPFQIRVLGLSSSSNKNVTPSKTKAPLRFGSSSLTLTLDGISDPQLVAIGPPRVRVTRAEDEVGQSLRSENENLFNFGQVLGGSRRIFVTLRPPDKSSQKIAHLDGAMIYTFATKREKWQIADVLNAKNTAHTFQSAGQTVVASISSAQKVGGAIQLKIKIQAAAKAGEQRNPLFIIEQWRSWLRVVDAKGQTLVPGSFGGSSNEGELNLEARFSPTTPDAQVLNEPAKLTFDVPSEFVQTEVPFSFSDLPLP